MDYYPLAKALHIIGFVSWFAGLFYGVRLFIYRVEATERPEAERMVLEDQLGIMSRRLWFAITWPAFIFTIGCGTWLLVQYGMWRLPWIHIKLTLVLLLSVYHFISFGYFLQLKKGVCTKSSNFFRLWNEVATLFLVAIVFVAVFKQGLDALWGTIGFFVFALVLMMAVKSYRKFRESS